MKTIGLIGGMSWESTRHYYRILNETVRERLGGLHSAKVALVSVDFGEIEPMLSAGDWDGLAEALAGAGRRVEAAGAEMLLICTNTMHRLAPQVSAAISIPLLHIADATASAVKGEGIGRVGLLGTRPTMVEEFYRGRLEEQGLEVVLPEGDDLDLVHRVIFEELCLGTVRDASRNEYVRIIENMRERGAQGVILGCTEIGMLVGAQDVSLPCFDTTEIHALAAVNAALDGETGS
ncbi:aspartate/glutamate racemase family protein [Salidesulfovibrio brasiliensis]|uniref:aspartate/glutamate racemase family protein n=1 Tax=Salidesulfovibrio brasiliensis TaxID=221711 RepID=UPI0006D20832|nr:aspartate/glutamate racemase family protein [Salidesulfovibrio brasiliensis]